MDIASGGATRCTGYSLVNCSDSSVVRSKTRKTHQGIPLADFRELLLHVSTIPLPPPSLLSLSLLLIIFLLTERSTTSIAGARARASSAGGESGYDVVLPRLVVLDQRSESGSDLSIPLSSFSRLEAWKSLEAWKPA